MTIEVKVPDIGDFKDVGVIEVLVKAGDTVKVEQSLITIESDKASMEIPSSHAGVVKEVKVKVGDVVNQGSVILALEESDAAATRPFTSPLRRGGGALVAASPPKTTALIFSLSRASGRAASRRRRVTCSSRRRTRSLGCVPRCRSRRRSRSSSAMQQRWAAPVSTAGVASPRKRCCTSPRR